MPLSKHDISEYYSNPTVRKALLDQIKNRPILAVQTLPSGPVYRRNNSENKPIQINQARLNSKDKQDLAWYTDRRFSEFHPVVGKETDQVWVDIDPGPHRNTESLKSIATEVVGAMKKLPGVENVQLAYSGGRGFHVRGDLKQSKNTNEARKDLTKYLTQEFKEKDIVFDKPTGNQVRLDTSTLKDTGSIRALYSINSETGRVALPLTLKELAKFNPEDADLKQILRQRETAPGIPGSKRTHDLPQQLQRKDWTLAVQEHDAKKAGKHWDLRLVDPHTQFAHSWAIPKSQFPERGSKPLLAVQTPTHSSRYALTFGEHAPRKIQEGYGAGTVHIKHKEPVQILQASPDKIKFERIIEGEPEQYMLFKAKDKNWLLRNITKDKKMKTAQVQGYLTALKKLGLAEETDSKSKMMENPSTGESQQALETNDQELPAGQLASMLAQMDTPELDHRREPAGRDSVDTRLNRDVSWSSPTDIPGHFMTGATTSIPGAF